MEQQQRFDGNTDERKPPARESAPPASPPAAPQAGAPTVEADGSAPDGDLALEEFELDDIEEIESKVFA